MTTAIRALIPRFRLRSLLILYSILTAGIALYSAPWHRQAAAVARFAPGVEFWYLDRWPWLTYSFPRSGNPHIKGAALSELDVRILGVHGAFRVVYGKLDSDNLTDPSPLSDLPELTELTITVEYGNGLPVAEIVARTPHLVLLVIRSKCSLTTEDFRAIHKLPRLRDLYLEVPDDERFEECLREITANRDVAFIDGHCVRLSPTMVHYLASAPVYNGVHISSQVPPDAWLAECLAHAQPHPNTEYLLGDTYYTDLLPIRVRFSDGPRTKLNPP